MQPVPPQPAVEYAERTDPGRDPDKQVNEDACRHGETRFGHVCVVCVGMGSNLVTKEMLAAKDFAGIEKKVRETIQLIKTIRGK